VGNQLQMMVIPERHEDLLACLTLCDISPDVRSAFLETLVLVDSINIPHQYTLVLLPNVT
jgi:hypothetical protein